MNNNDKIKFSKTISYLLRHGAIENNLKIDKQGYVEVLDLLSNHKLKDLTFENLQNIVNTDNKNRFDIKFLNGKYYIRANQGHSKLVGNEINDDELLEEITIPIKSCFHGTYKKNLDDIKKLGLSRMNRKHIHFTDKINSISGIRYNSDVLIYINMEKAINDGIKFYKSKNGVILSEGDKGIINTKYFEKIIFV